MKIRVESDSHDYLENLAKAIEMIKQEGAKALLQCGDLCTPFVIKKSRETGMKTHLVFGNVSDQHGATKTASRFDNVTLHGLKADLELEQKKTRMIHHPELTEALAATGKYDAVFYEHDHTQNIEKIKDTLLMNTGEIIGRIAEPSFAIYTDINQATIKEIKELKR